MRRKNIVLLAALLSWQLLQAATTLPAPPPRVPGVVIDYSPANSGLYIGSPSIVILTSGQYLASHDLFGPKSHEHDGQGGPTTVVLRSEDRGRSWKETARLTGQFWSSLFVYRGDTYILGTDKHHGRVIIRRSTDSGNTWTAPTDTATGLLTPEGQYHTAPTPVIEANGRLWRGFEDAMGGTEWGKRYRVPGDDAFGSCRGRSPASHQLDLQQCPAPQPGMAEREVQCLARRQRRRGPQRPGRRHSAG